ncbi:MurR/RpiR family transcriptional regulator [Jeotgalibaca caeni]|uniref:MurR/RpiR family transcriptional regulator n=1 Tax=Jeotgalibaca caeni TaxID=3028623 RepID=UPI00237E5542|nr:MurR/RpiR family transcriptional regulator [Jeotgalibaca caeni]MDE1548606.1 MurR/RpiR family transcriptional regulator [Jeotgalibaca caeni]
MVHCLFSQIHLYSNRKEANPIQQNIVLSIKEKLPALPESERKIGELVTEKPLEIIQMNASQLAEAAGSSAAAVIRFCRSMGLNGYTELKLQLSAESNLIQEDLYTDILPDEGLDQIKKKLLVHTNFTLEKTNSALDNERMEQAATWLVDCPTLYVYGLGASYLVALDIKQKLSRIGKQVLCTQDQHELAASMAIAQPGSVYIGISNSGEKKEGLVLMEVANKWGLHTVSLTKDTDNSLSKLAEVALKTADTKEAPLRSGATISLLNQLYAVDVLFLHFMTKRYTDNIHHLERSRKATDDLNEFFKQYNNA